MSGTMGSRPDGARADAERRRRVRLAQMESDLAYFQARLEIIGEPETTNQLAQRKVFKLLYQVFGNHIVHARQRLAQQK